MAITVTATPCFCFSSYASCDSFSAPRETSTRSWWSAAKRAVRSRPMPEVGPVIRAVLRVCAFMALLPFVGTIEERAQAVRQLAREVDLHRPQVGLLQQPRHHRRGGGHLPQADHQGVHLE